MVRIRAINPNLPYSKPPAIYEKQMYYNHSQLLEYLLSFSDDTLSFLLALAVWYLNQNITFRICHL